MAQPISSLAPHQNGAGVDRQLREAPQRHADAILSALELLQLLHDRGVLELLRGMVGAGDQLVDTLTAAVDNPESLRAIRNFLLLTKFFGSVHPDVLNSLVQTVVEGAEREKAHRAPGLLQLLRRLRSEDSRHAIAVTLDLLESVGKAL
ncbi:MAG TPA: hypothetical protein VNX70_01185 [Bryobacteraceae bacterium]|nr:hypothetical protein [Bryobacteraceae bacterium]